MSTVKQEVNINDDSISLWIDAEIDGKKVYSAQGHSLLTNFLVLLQSFMSGQTIETYYGGISTTGSNNSIESVTKAPLVFANETVSMVDRTYIVGTAGGWLHGDIIEIFGIGNGSLGTGLNGRFVIQTRATGSWYLLPAGGGGYVYDADAPSIDYGLCTPMGREIATQTSSGRRSDSNTFTRPQLVIGYSNAANTVETGTLVAEIPIINSGTSIGTVTQGAMVVSEPAVGSNISIIEMNQSFTNNGSQAISVNEVGLWVKHVEVSSTFLWLMIARDVLDSPVSIGVGQTLALSYRIIVGVDTVGGTGGILASFNEILYRHLGNTSREAKDVFNQNHTDVKTTGEFMVASGSGNNKTQSGIGGEEHQYLGPQIGHSSKNVQNTDFRLQYAADDMNYAGGTAIEAEDARYLHGRNQYQVQYIGPVVDEVVIDDIGGESYFTVSNVIHNLSGSTITVNQMGLYVGRVLNSTIDNAFCMLSNKLAAPISFLDDEIMKVEYVFKLTF